MSLKGQAPGSVSPAHCVGSSFTYAGHSPLQAHSPTALWIARHAKPLIALGICYGATDVEADPALTQTAAQALAEALPPHVVVRTSPLRRCVQLAEALQVLRPELAFTVDARLREMDFGSWEGVPWSDIPKEAVDAWTDDFAHHRFGGAESANDVLARVAAVWDETRDTPTLWIAHAGVAQAARLLLKGVRHIEAAKDWPTAGLGYGEWFAV